MKKIFNGWTLPRFFYFLIGGLIFVQSLLVMEWLGIVAGGYFTAMGLFGFGCASGQCYPMMKNTKSVYWSDQEKEYKAEETKIQ
jgi:hypothetical protein